MKIFITGVSSGIGRELSKRLASKGNEVWGVSRRIDLLKKLSQEIGKERFHFNQCDITNPIDVQGVCKKMQKADFLPDVIFLNAAVDLEDEYPHLSMSQSTEILRTNIEGAFIWVSAFIELFLKRGSGQFIAISSLFANWPDKSSVAYSASKAGLSMLFRGLRLRYMESNILFKTIYLGPINTEINPRFRDKPPEKESLLIASAEDTAKYLENTINSKRRNFYYPFYIMVIFQTLKWLPDNLFEFLTQKFRR